MDNHISRSVLPTISPLVRGSWYYLGYWGITGGYLNFINVFFIEIGLTAAQLGLLSALLPLLAITLAPVVAAWADRQMMRVRLVRVSLVGLGASLLVLFFARDFVAVLVAYLFLATFTSLVQPLADGLIVRMAVRYRLEYGRMRLWGGVAFAVVALVSGWLWSRLGYTPMFLVCGVLFLVFAASAGLLKENITAPSKQRFQPSQVLGDPGMLSVLAVSLVVGLGWGLATPFLGVYIESLGGSATQIGLFYALVGIGSIPTMRFQAYWVRKLGNAGVLALGCACMAINYAGIALVQDPNWLVVTSPLEGVGFALFFVGTVHLVDQRATSGRSSTMQAIRHGLTYGIAPLVASPIGGLVFGFSGAGVFALASGLMLVGAFIALRGRKRLEQNTRSQEEV
jgi:MFS transporter, PPP family, 3-phenylpropionic acid transporter